MGQVSAFVDMDEAKKVNPKRRHSNRFAKRAFHRFDRRAGKGDIEEQLAQEQIDLLIDLAEYRAREMEMEDYLEQFAHTDEWNQSEFEELFSDMFTEDVLD